MKGELSSLNALSCFGWPLLRFLQKGNTSWKELGRWWIQLQFRSLFSSLLFSFSSASLTLSVSMYVLRRECELQSTDRVLLVDDYQYTILDISRMYSQRLISDAW